MTNCLRSTAATAAWLMLGATGVFAANAGAVSQQATDQWRASKLAGVAIFGPGHQPVGKVSDVLMEQDGKARFVVVAVGGFLGLGEKDVAIPFDQVRFTNQPILPPPNPAPTDNMAAPAATAGAAPAGTPMAGAATAGDPNATVEGTADDGNAAPASPMPPAGMVRSTAYPDHGEIDMTADQLKAAPTFKFAK